MQPTELTAEQIAAIRARHEAATPGEWTTQAGEKKGKPRPPTKSIFIKESATEEDDLYGGPSRYGPSRDYIANFINFHPQENAINNAAFAACAHQDIPALLSHAAALAAKVARLESRWQKDAMQIDTDMDDLREERDDALAKFATTETLCDSLKAKVARLERELEKATDALTETCDMIKCPICEEWTDPSSLCDGDGDFEPMCDSCYGAATHECSECSFRPGKPDDFDVCPMCEGEIVERPKEDSAHVAHD